MSLELTKLIIKAIEDKKCLPFLGAGASAGYLGKDQQFSFWKSGRGMAGENCG